MIRMDFRSRKGKMKIETNKIITLADKEEFLVIDKVICDNKEYFYVAEVNDDKTDIKDNYKIVTINEEDNKYYFNEVLGEANLKKVLPLFLNK